MHTTKFQAMQRRIPHQCIGQRTCTIIIYGVSYVHTSRQKTKNKPKNALEKHTRCIPSKSKYCSVEFTMSGSLSARATSPPITLPYMKRSMRIFNHNTNETRSSVIILKSHSQETHSTCANTHLKIMLRIIEFTLSASASAIAPSEPILLSSVMSEMKEKITTHSTQ